MHTFFSTRSNSAFVGRPFQAVLGAVAAALLVAGNPLTTLPADAAPAGIKRIAGDTRLATAAQVAAESFPGGTQWAVITGADDWHATLGSAALAGELKAAQLLAWPDRLDETGKALDRLGVKKVIIVGSIDKVSGAVERQLRAKYTVERIAPADLGEGNQYELARLLTARTIVAAGGQATDTPGQAPSEKPVASPSDTPSATPSSTPTNLPSSTSTTTGTTSTDTTGTDTTGTDTTKAASKAGSTSEASPVQAPTELPVGANQTTSPETVTSEALATETAPEAAPVLTGELTQGTPKFRPTTPKWQLPSGFAVLDNKRTIFVASGNAFPDALAASGISYYSSVPVLYVDSPKKDIPEHTTLALRTYKPERIIILGGTSVISEQAAAQLQQDAGVPEILRLSGQDRVATSVAVAKWSVDHTDFDPHTLSVARGDAFPDAMTSAQYAANHRSPLVLSTAPKYLTDVPVKFALDNCKAMTRIVGFGGKKALDDTVLKAFSTAGGCKRPSSLPQVAPANPSKPNPKPTTKPTGQPSTPAPRPTDTTPAPGPTTPPMSGVDPMKHQAITKWKIHPDYRGRLDQNASGLQDKISTLSFLSLAGTRDGSRLPKQVNWGLFACNKVRLDNKGVPIFSDTDNDRYADGLGHASNEGIDITGINGQNVANGKLLLNQPVTSKMTNAILTSGIDDCAWVAAFDPKDNNKIRIDKEGRATTPLGLGWLRIGNGPKPGEQRVREVNPQHVYNVTPEETTVRSNAPVDLVVKRKDGKPVSGRLSVVAMPCKDVRIGQGDVIAKQKPNDPRAAAGYGNTDTNSALVTHFMGKPDAEPRRVFTANPVNGQYHFTVHSGKADCGAFMVINGNGNGKLDLDAAGRPTEPFGVATVRWTK